MPDSLILILILILIIIGFGVFLYLIYQKLTKVTSGTSDGSAVLLQNQINTLVHNLDYKLSETNKIIQDQLNLSNDRLHTQNSSNNELLRKINENNNKILQEVSEKLVKVEDTNRQVVNFAEQLQSLENILKSPKQRGILGEYFLETILANVLSISAFKMQYAFNDGVIVDAVIFARDRIVPIDAKFSLEGFNRLHEIKESSVRKKMEREFLNDVKKRIDETSKYVKPEENTIDLAFMFVPADGVYQEIIQLGCGTDHPIDIISYAYSKKVVIVSPTSFFAYLQTVLQALNTIKIEEKVGEIIKNLQESTRYIKQFSENMDKLGKNIGTVVNTYNRANDDARKLSKRIKNITENDEDLIKLPKIELDEFSLGENSLI
jgi:DNA recombination protein RmuC